MKMRTSIIIFFILTSISSYAQFNEQNFETDSSIVRIIKNSVYHTYRETYKNKDSVWYSVHFIKDTTKLKTQGWQRKNGKRLGIWKEYKFNGDLLFERDYENAVCKINKDLFPFHTILEQKKKKADSLIISNYSQEFFENHVRFNFNCYAYDEDGYVGSWTEPMKRKPSKFLFRYQVRLKNSDWQNEMIGIELDEKGNYIPSHDRFNNHGFEKLESKTKTFTIDKSNAISVAKREGLSTEENIIEFLNWERLDQGTFYTGRFKYTIAELTDQIEEIKNEGRSKITYKYNVYSFDPWTGEFLEVKKMKKMKVWSDDSGLMTNLLSDQ